MPYLDKACVTRYIALEPNALMHASIRAEADRTGFHEADGSLVILGCGAEDTSVILQALSEISTSSQTVGAPDLQLVDTVIAIRTLCTVPDAPKAMAALIREAVKPGGLFLMYEHVLNHQADVAWWQRFWTPLWSVVFDGCRLDRDTDVWARELKMHAETDGDDHNVAPKGLSAWREFEMWDVEENEEDSMLWHTVGRFVKA